MALVFYYHPLASFCWKSLIALYERNVAFTPVTVDLGDAASREAFEQIWPMAKFPVLRDEARDLTLPESSIIIEYVDRLDGSPQLIPHDADAALQVRLWDRFYDHYIHHPMQAIVADRLRDNGGDPFAVAAARSLLDKAYAVTAQAMRGKTWVMGGAFSLADCAAAPALHYANIVHPFGSEHGPLTIYLERLEARASFARVLKEAEPWRHLFPSA